MVKLPDVTIGDETELLAFLTDFPDGSTQNATFDGVRFTIWREGRDRAIGCEDFLGLLEFGKGLHSAIATAKDLTYLAHLINTTKKRSHMPTIADTNKEVVDAFAAALMNKHRQEYELFGIVLPEPEAPLYWADASDPEREPWRVAAGNLLESALPQALTALAEAVNPDGTDSHHPLLDYWSKLHGVAAADGTDGAIS